MTDEDIQAMKERQAARSPLGNLHWNAAYIDIAKLLFEVEALYRMMPGWQSVADGAKPGPEDWYVAAIVTRERNIYGLTSDEVAGYRYRYRYVTGNANVIAELLGRARYPGTPLPDHTTHFLVIPPPPIKRES